MPMLFHIPPLRARPHFVPPAPDELAPLATLLDAQPSACRWPIGEGQEICGRPKCSLGSGSYCEFHWRRSLRTPPKLENIPSELTVATLSEIG